MGTSVDNPGGGIVPGPRGGDGILSKPPPGGPPPGGTMFDTGGPGGHESLGADVQGSTGSPAPNDQRGGSFSINPGIHKDVSGPIGGGGKGGGPGKKKQRRGSGGVGPISPTPM